VIIPTSDKNGATTFKYECQPPVCANLHGQIALEQAQPPMNTGTILLTAILKTTGTKKPLKSGFFVHQTRLTF